MASATEGKSSKTTTASAVMAMAGRAARACDVCGRDRARWYCAADEAYLCGRCDNSVHCVNALASRHGRVRLGSNGVPCKGGDNRSDSTARSLPGLQIKKTAKGGKHHAQQKRRTIKDEMLAQSFFSNPEDTRVPEYSEVVTENLHARHGLPAHVPELPGSADEQGVESPPSDGYPSLDVPQEFDCLERGGEGVVGTSDDDEYLDFSDIVTEADFLDDNGDDGSACYQENIKSKYSPDTVKSEDLGEFHPGVGTGLELTNVKAENVAPPCAFHEEEGKRNLPPLKLNYEDIISAWSGRGPFWTDDDGQPQTVPVFPNMDLAQREQVGEVPVLGLGDEALEVGGGREARVMRYRQKRRSRLFSKQIRYEVRKLNAERRPRMKGRFVKRLPP